MSQFMLRGLLQTIGFRKFDQCLRAGKGPMTGDLLCEEKPTKLIASYVLLQKDFKPKVT